MGNRLRCNRRDCGGEGLSTETFLQQEGHDCADREHRPRGMLLQKRPGRSLGSARMCRQAADTHPTRSLRRGEKSGAGGGNACSPRPRPCILPEPAAPIRPALVSTSANISGEATPKGFGDIAEEIRAGVDYTVDIRCEGAPTRKASSIIMLGEDGEVKIIRE